MLLPIVGFCAEGDTLAVSEKQKPSLSLIRPAFFEFSYRTLPAVNAFPEDKRSNFEANKHYRIKLNIPIKLSGKLNVIGQLRYNNEQLHLGRNLNMEEQDIHFDNLGASLLFKYQLENRFFIAGHTSGAFKADKIQLTSYNSIFDFSSSALLGKNTEYGQIGGGLIVGNSMGRFRIFPLLLLDYQVTNKFRVEMKLPREAFARLIIKPDDFYIKSGFEVNAAAYSVSQILPSLPANIEFRRASLDFRTSLEKELYDFLWLRIDAGLTVPINSAIVERGLPTNERLIRFDQSISPFTGFSIYLVPPEKLFDRKKF